MVYNSLHCTKNEIGMQTAETILESQPCFFTDVSAVCKYLPRDCNVSQIVFVVCKFARRRSNSIENQEIEINSHRNLKI